jgi:uncharacterized alpha-E superfamily protein
LADALIARSAGSIFWLGRYVERAENLARILDVNATFARDARGAQDWMPVLLLNADAERFLARHPAATAEAVLRFYVADRENPTSIASAVRAARENARTLRPLISNEMWAQLNVFHKRLGALGDAALAPGELTRLFGWIKEACQAHTGIAEGTFHRDQGWYFYRLGRHVERADQTTRLLDIKYHLLLPRPSDVGSPIDVGQWNALLRSAAAYQTYRRVEPDGVTPAGVAGFLLLHPRFPRSVAFCVGEADRLLASVRARHGLAGGDEAAEDLGRLRATLGALTIGEVLSRGLHEFLDLVQRRLIAFTEGLSVAFFGERPAVGAAAAQAQRQAQRQAQTGAPG